MYEGQPTSWQRAKWQAHAWRLAPWRTLTFVLQIPRLRRLGRYRWRTAARLWFPYELMWLFPKGNDDCGDHDWYKHDDVVSLCCHCVCEVRSQCK
jgi:hypothetical protein